MEKQLGNLDNNNENIDQDPGTSPIPNPEVSPLGQIISSSQVGEKKERRRIYIPPGMPAREVMEKYNVSRTTAWRVREGGYVNTNYRERIIDPDLEWNNINQEIIVKSARKGIISVIKKMANSRGKNIAEFLAPYNIEDAIQEGIVRIMELSQNPKRDIEAWRVGVAKIAAYNYVNSILKKAKWRSYQNLYTEDPNNPDDLITEEDIDLREHE